MSVPIRRLKAVDVSPGEVHLAQMRIAAKGLKGRIGAAVLGLRHKTKLSRVRWRMRLRHWGGRLKWPLVRLWDRIRGGIDD